MRCIESARLISERRDHPLPLGKRIGLRFHLLVCALCRTYEKQIVTLCGISHQAGINASSHAPALPPDRKQAIQSTLEQQR